jgi:hypothetical protein
VHKLTENAAQPVVRDLTDEIFTEFNECSMAEVRKTLLASPVKSCSMDSLPMFLLREFVDDLLSFICIMCMPLSEKTRVTKAAIITPVLKKSNLDPEDCKN